MSNVIIGGDGDDSGNKLIEYICVVGFHHQLGNRLEHIYPEISDVNKNRFEWNLLPFLALPDGVHNSQEDYCFFTLNEINPIAQPPRRLYALSQFKQVNKQDLPTQALSESDTRQSVQKSICILSSFPIFYTFKTQLSVASYCYFNQGDFNNIDLLKHWYKQQNEEFDTKCQKFIDSNSVDHGSNTQGFENIILSNSVVAPPKIPIPADLFLGSLSLRMFVSHFGRNSLTLFKLVMLERGVIVFNPQPVNAVCESILAVVSLFPRLFDDFLSQNAFINRNYKIDWGRREKGGSSATASTAATTAQLEEYALPLHLFSSKCLLHPYLSLHQLALLSPAAPIAQPLSPSTLTGSGGRLVNNYKGFLVGTSNSLFLKAPPQTTHAIVDIQSSEIIYRDESLHRIMELTSSDRRFIDNIINCARDHQDSQYLGSDQWIRDQFEQYILCLVAHMATLIKIEAGKTIITHLDTAQQYNEWWVRSWATTRNFNLWRSQLFKVNPTPSTPSKYPIHPSGPPSDILDNIQDKLTNSIKDLEPLTSGISKALFGASSFLFSSGQSFINKVMDDDTTSPTPPNTSRTWTPLMNRNNNNNNNNYNNNSNDNNSDNNVVEGHVEEMMKESWSKVQENSYIAASKAANAMKPLVSGGKVLAKQLSSSLIQIVAPDPNGHQNQQQQPQQPQQTTSTNSSTSTTTTTSNHGYQTGVNNVISSSSDEVEVDLNSPNTLTHIFQKQQSNPTLDDSFSKMELLEEIDSEDVYEL